jgi:serpin B
MLNRASSLRSAWGLLNLVLCLAACGASPTSGSESATGGGSPELDKSSVPRAPASGISQDTLASAVAANNAFALDVYARIRSSAATSNLLISPLSASLALTMAYAGAHGETATQMATALHFASAASSIFSGQNALIQSLSSDAPQALARDRQNSTTPPNPSDYQLQIVNSVWGEQTYPWQKPFLDTLAENYGAGIYLDDFIGNLAATTQAINSWVSTQTDDKINMLLQRLDPNTRLVLVNALHLKLPWSYPFPATATAPAAFTTGTGSTVSTPFMNQMQPFGYLDDGQAKIVSLPLAEALAVIITLPYASDLSTYESTLTAQSSAVRLPPESMGSLVNLSLPKVTFTSATFSLASILQSMGMTDAFDPNDADFSNLCERPLFISDVLQKTCIAVEETGVEAAAATAAIFEDAAASTTPPPTVVVNRPFLLSIVDQATGAILFIGHITDPTDNGSP